MRPSCEGLSRTASEVRAKYGNPPARVTVAGFRHYVCDTRDTMQIISPKITPARPGEGL